MEANSNSTKPAGVAEGRQASVERALSHGGLPRIGSTESQQHNGPAGDHPRKRLPAKQTSRSFSDLSRCGPQLAAAAYAQPLGERPGAARTSPRWVRAQARVGYAQIQVVSRPAAAALHRSSVQHLYCSAHRQAARACAESSARLPTARALRAVQAPVCCPGCCLWPAGYADGYCAACRAASHGRRGVRQQGSSLDSATALAATLLFINRSAQRSFAHMWCVSIRFSGEHLPALKPHSEACPATPARGQRLACPESPGCAW